MQRRAPEGKSYTWGMEAPADKFKNERLTEELYRYAALDTTVFDELFSRPPVVIAWWQPYWWRLRDVIDPWLPRIHFGPCDSGEDY